MSNAELLIDGEPFPWLIAENGVQIGPPDSGKSPSVTITLLADAVSLSHDLRMQAPDRLPPEDTRCEAVIGSQRCVMPRGHDHECLYEGIKLTG